MPTQGSASDTTDVSSLPRGSSVGRYVLLDPLGAGGMGVVYGAYDPELDRKVALKLLHGDSSELGGDSRSRLLREAQAMARLSHPNVITVHDVGTYQGRVFVAMEFVEGSTLTQWLAEKKPTPAEIVAVFREAARGLSAAHGAGLVHRDFKPDNVFLGKDGRVCVGDFGLARPAADLALGAQAPAIEAEDLSLTDASGMLRVKLTRAGLVLGTMEYMAPEQFLGHAVDARSDQFAFCAALWEALYGQLPFAGGTMHVLAQNVIAGKIHDPPKDSPVPAWLRRILLRGLGPDPAQRYPSIDALNTDLGHDPALRRRRALLVTGAALIAMLLVVGLFLLRGQQRRVCLGAEEKLAGVWDEGRKRAVEAALLGTGRPQAGVSFAGARDALDRYTGAWVAMHTAACQATRLSGEQSEEVLDLRMECLGDRLKEVEALTGLFSRADAGMLDKAVQATEALTPLDLCADAAALRAGVRPPREPEKRKKVAELRKALAEAKALKHAGKFAEGLKRAQGAAQAAPAVGYRPIEAEASYMVGDLLGEAGDFRAAEAELLRALWAALASRHDKVAARTSARLVTIVGVLQARHEMGRLFGDHARADIERAGGDPLLEAKLLNSLGVLAIASGLYEEAVRHLERAVALRTKENHPDHPIVAESVNNLGQALQRLGRYAESQIHYQRALAIWEKSLGPTHPSVALALSSLGTVAMALGRPAEAARHLLRALELRKKALGPEHPKVAETLRDLADVHSAMGHSDEALAQLQEALPLLRKAHGPNHPSVSACLNSIGQEQLRSRRYREALAAHQQALAIQQRTLKPDHPEIGRTLRYLAAVNLAQKKTAEGLLLLGRALLLLEKALGPEHPQVAAVLLERGEAQLPGRALPKAVLDLERALAICGKEGAKEQCPSALRGGVRFALAQALRRGRREPERAQKLAQEARDDFVHAGGAVLKDLERVNSWLER